jgi:hypothetical protein
MKRLVSGIMLMLLLMVMFSLALNIKPVKSEPRTIVVPGDYPTLQDAVNHAEDGDEIKLNGRTNENLIVINKSISLSGYDGYGYIYGDATIISHNVRIYKIWVYGNVLIKNSNSINLDESEASNVLIYNSSKIYMDFLGAETITIKDSKNVNLMHDDISVFCLERTSICSITYSIVNQVILKCSSEINFYYNGINNIILSNVSNCNISRVEPPYRINTLQLYSSSYCKISNCEIWTNNKFGICANYASHHNVFSDITIKIFGDGDGLWVFGSNNNFTNVDLTIWGSGYLCCEGSYSRDNTINFSNVYVNNLLGFVNYDFTPPNTTCSIKDVWYKLDLSIKLECSDNLSGISETYYRINNGSVKAVSIDGQPLITTESMNNTIEYWSVDNAGNEELPHKILTGIKLDKTAPSIVHVLRVPEDNVEPGQDVKVSVNVTDLLSGVQNVVLLYTLNHGTSWNNLTMTYNSTNGLYETTIKVQQANVQVKYKIIAYDIAGNCRVEDNSGQYYTYTIIPEFPSTTILTIFMLMTTTLAALTRLRRLKHRR